MVNECNNVDKNECRKIIRGAREKILDTQVKFELLSDIADGFEKCESCGFNPCYDRENMIAIRDLYYKMENAYLEMLHDCDIYVDKMEQQQCNEKIIHNEEVKKW